MTVDLKIYNVPALGTPLGQYSHITRVKASEYLFIAGIVGVNEKGDVAGNDVTVQLEKTFENIETALKSAGAGWKNVVQFMTYMVHSQDIPKFMEFRLRQFPKYFPDRVYPPNTLLVIDRLVKESLLVEVQTVAAL